MRQPIGLPPVGGDLAEELVRGDARRGGQAQLFPDLSPDRLGHVEPASRRLRNREVSLVEGERLDAVGVAKEDLARQARETARYRAKSGGTKVACGQRRSAVTAGIAERTPKRRAS